MVEVYNLKNKKIVLDDNRYYFLIHPDFKNKEPNIMRITYPRILGKNISKRIKGLGRLNERWVNQEKVYVEDATFYKEKVKMRGEN